MTYAEVSDVTRRLGRDDLDDVETEQIQAWLEDAESQIRSRIRNLDAIVVTDPPAPPATLAPGQILASTLRSVEARAVVRVALNPEGYRSWGTDDVERTRDTALSSGQIYIAPDEWVELQPHLVQPMPQAYTLTLGTQP